MLFRSNGLVTDQYGTYNSLTRVDAPSIHVKFGEEKTTGATLEYNKTYGYDRYVTMNGYDRLTIDWDGIYAAMRRNGVTQMDMTLSLVFPSRSVASGNNHATTITIQCPEKNLNSGKVATTSMSQMEQYEVANQLQLSMVSRRTSQKQFEVQVGTVTMEAGTTTEVRIDLNKNPGIWGMLMQLHYDADTFELVSVAESDLFHTTEIVVSEELAQENVTLLLSRNQIASIRENGGILVLHLEDRKRVV